MLSAEQNGGVSKRLHSTLGDSDWEPGSREVRAQRFVQKGLRTDVWDVNVRSLFSFAPILSRLLSGDPFPTILSGAFLCRLLVS